MFKYSNRSKIFIIIGVITFLIIVIGGGIFVYKYYTGQKLNKQQNYNVSDFIWEGSYNFTEISPATPPTGVAQTWSYNLSISSADGKWHVVLNVDGFQTLLRINATANNVGNSLDVVFDSYASSDSMQRGFKKGDVLFTLTPVQKGLAIEWKKMQPNLPKSLNDSFFEKKTNEITGWKKYDNEDLEVSLEYPSNWSIRQINHNPLIIKIYSPDNSSQIYISNLDLSGQAKYTIGKTGKGGFLLANWQYDSSSKDYIKRIVALSTNGEKYTSINLIVKNDLAKGEMDKIVDTVNFQNTFLHKRKEIDGGTNNGLLSTNISTSNWLTYNYKGITFKYPAILHKKINWPDGVHLFTGPEENPWGKLSVVEFSTADDLSLYINFDSELLLRDVILTKTKVTINGLDGEIIDRKTNVGISRMFTFKHNEKYILFKPDPESNFMNLDVVNAIYNSINKI